MMRNNRSHLMSNRRCREENKELKTKTQFWSSYKMTHACVQANIIGTVT